MPKINVLDHGFVRLVAPVCVGAWEEGREGV